MKNIKRIVRNFLSVIGYIFLTSLIFAIFYTSTNKDDISYLISYILMIVIFGLIYKDKLLLDLKNIKKDLKGNIKKITIFCILFTILMYIANIVLYNLTGNIAENEETVRKIFFESPILMGLNIILLGPITEELTYRFPFKAEKTQNLTTFLFYTSIFALTHIASITQLSDLLFIIPYFLLSLCFGYGFYKTNNIFVSMIIHIVNNFVNIMLLLI